MPRRIAFSSPRERAVAAAVTAAVAVLIGWALLAGLTVRGRAVVTDALRSFSVLPPVPPPKRPVQPPPPPRSARHRPTHHPAPPNRHAVPTEIVAPPPFVPLPPPVVTAPVAAIGAASSAGAAAVAGPGTGAGGRGSGLGGGGDGGDGSPAELISRDLELRDLPDAVLRLSFAGTVYFTFTVGTDGRVHDCRIDRSIGIPAVDAATCRAAEARLRYRAERDRSGRKIAVVIHGEQRWDNITTREGDDGDD